jgi:hypothetical protein
MPDVVLHAGRARCAIAPMGLRFFLRRNAGADELRVAGNHCFHADGGGECLQLRKNFLPAADTDGIAHDVLAIDGHERLFPDLMEHTYRGTAPAWCALFKLPNACVQGSDVRPGGIQRAGQLRQGCDFTGNCSQRARLAFKYRNAQLAQLRVRGRLHAAGPLDRA